MPSPNIPIELLLLVWRIGGSLDREEQGIGEEEQEQQQGRFLDEYTGRR